MRQSRTKVIHRLRVAQQDRRPVIVRRKHLNSYEDSGVVIAVLDDWVVLHELADGPYLDDVLLIRLDHVTKVKSLSDGGYLARAVEGLGEADCGVRVCFRRDGQRPAPHRRRAC